MFARALRIAGDTMLFTLETRGVDTHGTEVVWVDHNVCSFDAAARMTRLESFSERHWDAALARFDELSRAYPRTPRVENAASQRVMLVVELFNEGRFEECGALMAEGMRLEDRRSIVGGEVVGRAAHVANLETITALGDRNGEYAPLAVRGSTLALGRVTSDFGDWDSRLLALIELGADGLASSAVYFDDADLDAAIDELEERYIAGEGAPYAPNCAGSTR